MSTGWFQGRAAGSSEFQRPGELATPAPVGLKIRGGSRAIAHACGHEPEQDPREGGPTLGDERTTLVEYLRIQRATLELKWRAGEPWYAKAYAAMMALDAGEDTPHNRRMAAPLLYGRWDDAIAAHAAADVQQRARQAAVHLATDGPSTQRGAHPGDGAGAGLRR
jgi:hypothetical protein